jgi:hypothetical protein
MTVDGPNENSLPALLEASDIERAVLDAEWSWDEVIAAGLLIGRIDRAFRLKVGSCCGASGATTARRPTSTR